MAKAGRSAARTQFHQAEIQIRPGTRSINDVQPLGAAIRDKEGEEYRVESKWNSPFLSIFLVWREIRIAHAHLTFHEGHAELSDICVKHDIVTNNSPLRQLLRCVRKRDFRSRGLGSALLALAIEEAKRHGVKRIEGTMQGDILRLTTWYQSFGFEITIETNRIAISWE